MDRLTPALFAELVRLPAVLTVPGDPLLGAAAAGRARGSWQVASSSLLYLGGMALNDHADRLRDALERPGRPVPSGRVPAALARTVALRLLGAGLALAPVAGRARALRVAVPLTAAVWLYDTSVKGSASGPALMAACRGLDVLLGASSGPLRPAVPAALVVAGHTGVVTALSQHEVDGAGGATVRTARRRSWVVAAGPLALVLLRRRSARPYGSDLLLTAVASALYVAQVRPPLVAAQRQQSAALTRAAVGAQVLAVVPLQAALLCAVGAPGRAAAVLGLLVAGRRAATGRRVT